MSPRRKSEPPSKGETAHKPSRKVAIDEVLRTLQDLVNNELTVEAPKQPTRPRKSAAPGPGAHAPETALITAEDPPALPDDDGLVTESITLEALPEIGPEPIPTPESSIPPEGLQQDLPYLDVTPEALATTGTDSSALLVEPELPIPELPGTDAIDNAAHATGPAPEDDASTWLVEPEIPMPELPGADALDAEPAIEPPELLIEEEVEASALPDLAVESTAPEPAALELTPAEHGELHDIPVLEDAVELPDEPDRHAPSAPATPLPSAAGARRLAIQVAARLNVELRKQGRPGLSSDVITHLARLLEEALAKGAANMENNPPEKQ